jgi:hypothetical protein
MAALARCFFFALCCTVLSSGQIRAIPLPGPDLPALLRVNSARTVFFGPDIAQVRQEQTLISRGGGLFSLLGTGIPGSVLSIDAFRGLGTPKELQALGRALVAATVGIQHDCTSDSFGVGHIEITWYGRAGRQNTFRVASQGAQAPAPPCSAEVVQLVGEIERFVSDAVSHLPQD